MWFKKLTGFSDDSPENVRKNLYVEGNRLYSRINGRSFQYGSLEVATLASLKAKAPHPDYYKGQIEVKEVVADVQQLHSMPENQNALFQAASQFNLLEMVGPHVTPNQGVARYEYDLTQGPACAIACGAGTIYRNYFVPIAGKIGQSAHQQIDCLDLIGKALNNSELKLWDMKNGYALADQEGLLDINKHLNQLDQEGREALKDLLKIGIQWDTEVTIASPPQLVSQVYCSALPVRYSPTEAIYWEAFARLILEATYEATFYAALINLEKTASELVYLTLVGGGAFGNEISWIMDALKKTVRQFRSSPLKVKIVSYGQSNPEVQSLIKQNF